MQLCINNYSQHKDNTDIKSGEENMCGIVGYIGEQERDVKLINQETLRNQLLWSNQYHFK